MLTNYILIGALVLTVIAAITFILNRLKIAGPSEAVIVSGSRKGESGDLKVIYPGGKAFVLPVVQKATSLSLRQRNLELKVDGWDINMIPITVLGVALVKIGSSPELVRAAGERFDGVSDAEINKNAQEVLLSSLRAIIGQMTVSDLVRNRDQLGSKVTENAGPELEISGLKLDSLQISEIFDEKDYISNLGIPEAEKVRKDAAISQSVAAREANDARVDAQTKIAEKNKELAIREAEFKAETDNASAISDAAGPLAKAERDQEIAHREQGTAEQLALLREKQLDTEVRKPADARLYEIQKGAEADKAQEVAKAEASAEAIRLHGVAEAEAIRLRGNAEAETLMKRAEALKQLDQAGVTEMIINKLPEIARELASPMSNIDDLTIISTDGAGALPKAVAGNFAQLEGIVKSFTGHSISGMISGDGSDSSSKELDELLPHLEVPVKRKPRKDAELPSL